MQRIYSVAVLMIVVLASTTQGRAAGILTATTGTDQPIQIREHHVNVVINNGFARTEVHQTFFNPNDQDYEGVYTFPLPPQASLSEMTIFIGEQAIHGEVLEKQHATRVYQEERRRGNDTGLAEKNSLQSFDFAVSPVCAQAETRIRFVYYQPLSIDTGIGRYVYPLEDGGTDDAGASFWQTNSHVEHTFSVNLELKSAHPVSEVRVPGFEAAAVKTQLDDGHHVVDIQLQDAGLDRDLVFYYRLQDDLPGRIELVPYRAGVTAPGTFMMIITPGIDLQPLQHGSDYLLVLDISGSMDAKITTLTHGVAKALYALNSADRLRVVVFNSQATELTNGWLPMTRDNIEDILGVIQTLGADGGTNLYAGLAQGLADLDPTRATQLILVTDAVTNTGVLDPRAFQQLIQQYDIRIFRFPGRQWRQLALDADHQSSQRRHLH